MHFALGDVTALRFENVFNGILQGDDVLASLEIDLLDQSGQRRRFSTPDRSRDEDQPVLITRQQFQMLGQTELIHGANTCVDDSENNVGTETLSDYTGAISSLGVSIGKIGVPTLLNELTLCVREERIS